MKHFLSFFLLFLVLCTITAQIRPQNSLLSIQQNNATQFAQLETWKEIQVFIIPTNQDVAIKTKDKFIFYFKKAIFNTDCTDSIRIEIKELNNKSAIFLLVISCLLL